MGTFATQSIAQNNSITQVWIENTGVQTGVFGAPTCIDASDNVYRAGFEKQSNGSSIAKLQKIDSEGQLLWSISLTGTTTDKYEPSKVVTNGTDVYLSGIVTYQTSGESDFFISKVDQSGSVQWLTIDQSGGNDVASDLIFDGGSLYVCGTTERAGTYDMLLASYDDGGNQNWLLERDYAGLVDLGAKVFMDGSNIVVQGSSQSTPTDWDIASWFFDDAGNYLSEQHSGGLNAASDELRDGALNNGYIHLTGVSGSGSNYKFKAVCLDASNNILWEDIYDKNALREEGTALVATTNGFVTTGFVTSSAGNEDILVRKYDLSGTPLWSQEIDVHGANDRGVDIVEDSEGNYIVISDVEVGGQTDVYMHYIEASSGSELWSTIVSEDAVVEEKAQSIEATFGGEMYVTYESAGQTVTESYSYSDVDFPVDNESFSRGSLIITNSGQLRDDQGHVVTDVRYYTYGQHPEMYYADNRMSALVLDDDTTTNQVQRIDFDFVHARPTHVGQVTEHENETHFNYYEGAAKYEQQGTFDVLAYPELYSGIDAFVSSNSAGFKMTFVLKNGADLNDIKIDINGSSGFAVNGNDLEVSTIADPINWLAPYSYPKSDEEKANDGCIQYDIVEDNIVLTSSCGELSYPYVITLRSGVGAAYGVSSIGNMDWSTFFGGDGDDEAYSVATDSRGNIFIGGFVSSTYLNTAPGVNIPPLTSINKGHGIVAKFRHNTKLNWVCVFQDGSKVDVVKTFDNLNSHPDEAPEEVHVVGTTWVNFHSLNAGLGTVLPTATNPFKTEGIMITQGASKNLSDLFFATIDNRLGIQYFRSAFGGRGNNNNGVEHVYDMDIGVSGGVGYMYFVGSTDNGSFASLSSQNPPSFPNDEKFPVYNPNDGSYFEASNSTGNQRGFVAAINLSTYKLAYSSILPDFKAVYGIETGTHAAYCGEGISAAKIGRFDINARRFATTLAQTGSDFSNVESFNAVVSSSDGNIFFGLKNYLASGTLLTSVTAPQYQTSVGQGYLMRMAAIANVPSWDTYFGMAKDGQSTNWGTLSGRVDTRGNLGYSDALQTTFVANSTVIDVETQSKSGYFHQNTIPPPAQTNDRDAYIAAFMDNYFGKNVFSWGTIFGGEQLPDVVHDVSSYEYNGDVYALVVGRSYAKFGSTTNNINKMPVAQYGVGHFQMNNSSQIGASSLPVRSDIIVTRFIVSTMNISVQEYFPEESGLDVFPNPASTKVSIRLQDKLNSLNHIKVYDINGRCIIERSFIKKEYTDTVDLDLRNIAKGVYIINVNGQYNATIIKN